MNHRITARARIVASIAALAALLCLRLADAAETAAPQAAPASSQLPAELMKKIRAATFEVVLKKPESDPLQYERPLPLDLLPFAQRNDKYESIGTAFAIGAGSFVTAAHVANAVSGSMWGVPALRDAQGNVYPIDRVTRFSMHEDFIVFTATGAPRVAPLQTSTEFQIDAPVIAVGNALGQGIVARDGTLTSETPEDQDGRWKWLRFSAPASPGNSGGPLLDTQGRVIGLIARKSANENLNFALPIARVLNAPENRGSVDVRYTTSLPFMAARNVAKIEGTIDLPLGFADFDRRLIAIYDLHNAKARTLLMQDRAIFPRAKSSRVLADHFLGPNPGFVMQLPDGSWDAPRNNNLGTTTPFGDNSLVWTNAQAGATLFRIHHPNDENLAKLRGDSKLLAEQLLKGLPLVRTFGTERVRLTSLGDAGRPELVKDDLGRVWQQWRFTMMYSDSVLILSALPMPDGYSGFVRSARVAGLDRTIAEARLMMNFMQVSYSGRPPQWRAFLADTQLRPDSFGRWKTALDPAAAISLDLPRFTLQVDNSVLNISDRSLLSVFPGMVMDGDRPAWDVLALQLRSEPQAASRLLAYRRARPAPDAGAEANARWQAMTQLRGQYAGAPGGDPNNVWIRRVAGAEGKPLTEASFLYELMYITPTNVPRDEVARTGPKLPQMFVVREK